MSSERARRVWTPGESRPRCSCHGEPMKPDGDRWRCHVKRLASDRAASVKRNPRRVRMGAGGITFYVGHAPTLETAAQLRRRIKEEAPK